ncbi:MAG: site-2 protease family protein [Dehalococcoidia bacterium]
MGGSFTIARIAGIPIRIHFTWVFVLGLVSWSLAESAFPSSYPGWSRATYWITAVIAALLLFLSVLLHELSHSFVARARGIAVEGITLFIFGGVSQISEDARTPGSEFSIAVVGPVTSLVLGGICGLLVLAFGGTSGQVKAVLEYLASINVLLGLFNLIPGFPLDGGRVLRAIVWQRTKSLLRATVVVVGVSRTVGFLMIFVGVLITFNGGGFGGLWIAFIGWFLENAAGAALSQMSLHNTFGGVTVRDAMRTAFRTVVPALPISSLVEDYIAGSHERSFPVYGGSHLWGIVTLADVAHVPKERWPETPVEQIMTPRERLKTALAEAPIETIVGDLQRDGVKQLVVLEGDPERVAGLISRADLMDYLQVHQLLAGTH